MIRTGKLMGAALLLETGYMAGAISQPAVKSAVSQE